jgi:hypothetical protein
MKSLNDDSLTSAQIHPPLVADEAEVFLANLLEFPGDKPCSLAGLPGVGAVEGLKVPGRDFNPCCEAMDRKGMTGLLYALGDFDGDPVDGLCIIGLDNGVLNSSSRDEGGVQLELDDLGGWGSGLYA